MRDNKRTPTDVCGEASLQPLLHKSQITKQPKKRDISKEHSKQAKEREVVRKYKMFANSVFSL